ncbi:XRE family transcriptional regulator [Enterococcus hirae]|nr:MULTISPECIES: helix-turn-helix transcriptional regulator [Enterococcus]MDA3977363.1 helix-turn-helix transcriptional regulator [Enterococcus thailandicus]OQO39580.1 XRE family transcriptional regulator [Enterococcus hirae]OQO48350.1 XRE family transcriptional regulator [Enterococcus hirae]OQO58031.1 XRE family transcriptional regulator [Enterococcus hirae]
MENHMNFGETLQTKRKAEGLTQEDLANKLLVSSKTISNWETNKTTPDIDNVIRISRLFDISLNNLLLEGSTMVENIKKKAEIKQSKVYLACSSITNLVFLFILAVSPIFGELPIIISCALAIGTFFNFFCVLYFSRRYMELSDGKWDNRTNKQKIWSITFSVGLVIVLLAIILFIRFKYNAF